MSKERLEEIKELHEQANRAYHEKDFERMGHFLETLFTEEFTDWLIEQAEQVQELEKDTKEWEIVNESWKEINTDLAEQNRRYREALEDIRDISTTSPHHIARIALSE